MRRRRAVSFARAGCGSAREQVRWTAPGLSLNCLRHRFAAGNGPADPRGVESARVGRSEKTRPVREAEKYLATRPHNCCASGWRARDRLGANLKRTSP
jgi:hypothetical protein